MTDARRPILFVLSFVTLAGLGVFAQQITCPVATNYFNTSTTAFNHTYCAINATLENDDPGVLNNRKGGYLDTFGKLRNVGTAAVINNRKGAVIYIEPGGSLDELGGGSLNNAGVLVNGGSIDMQQSYLTNLSSGYLHNLASGTISVNYALDLEYGGTFDNNGAVTNWGSLLGDGTLNNYGRIDNNASLSNGFTLNNNSGGTLNNSSTGVFNNFDTINNAAGATINNAGFWQNWDSEVDFLDSTVHNSGTINNSFAIIVWPLATFTNDSGGTLNNLSGAAFEGPFTNNSGAILNNEGDFFGGEITNNYGGVINNFGTIEGVGMTNSGVLNNKSGSTFGSSDPFDFVQLINQPSGAINNSGVFILGANSTVNNMGTYTQWAGSTIVDGSFSSSTVIQIKGGSLSGIGTINGDVQMGGTMSPGDSPGALTLNGNYTQLAGGKFFAELAGLTPGTQYDQLLVSGTAALDGTLDVMLLNGFVVQLGDSFVLMTFAGESGQFNFLHLPSLAVGEMWNLYYDPTDLTLKVQPSPEPSTLILAGSALSLLGYRLRPRRNRA